MPNFISKTAGYKSNLFNLFHSRLSDAAGGGNPGLSDRFSSFMNGLWSAGLRDRKHFEFAFAAFSKKGFSGEVQILDRMKEWVSYAGILSSWPSLSKLGDVFVRDFSYMEDLISGLKDIEDYIQKNFIPENGEKLFKSYGESGRPGSTFFSKILDGAEILSLFLFFYKRYSSAKVAAEMEKKYNKWKEDALAYGFSSPREMAYAQSDIVFENEKYLVVLPGSRRASQFFGSGTRWCTAADKENQFDNYSSDGVFLYYILDKEGDAKDLTSKIAVSLQREKKGDVKVEIFLANDFTLFSSENLNEEEEEEEKISDVLGFAFSVLRDEIGSGARLLEKAILSDFNKRGMTKWKERLSSLSAKEIKLDVGIAEDSASTLISTLMEDVSPSLDSETKMFLIEKMDSFSFFRNSAAFLSPPFYDIALEKVKELTPHGYFSYSAFLFPNLSSLIEEKAEQIPVNLSIILLRDDIYSLPGVKEIALRKLSQFDSKNFFSQNLESDRVASGVGKFGNIYKLHEGDPEFDAICIFHAQKLNAHEFFSMGLHNHKPFEGICAKRILDLDVNSDGDKILLGRLACQAEDGWVSSLSQKLEQFPIEDYFQTRHFSSEGKFGWNHKKDFRCEIFRLPKFRELSRKRSLELPYRNFFALQLIPLFKEEALVQLSRVPISELYSLWDFYFGRSEWVPGSIDVLKEKVSSVSGLDFFNLKFHLIPELSDVIKEKGEEVSGEDFFKSGLYKNDLLSDLIDKKAMEVNPLYLFSEFKYGKLDPAYPLDLFRREGLKDYVLRKVEEMSKEDFLNHKIYAIPEFSHLLDSKVDVATLEPRQFFQMGLYLNPKYLDLALLKLRELPAYFFTNFGLDKMPQFSSLFEWVKKRDLFKKLSEQPGRHFFEEDFFKYYSSPQFYSEMEPEFNVRGLALEKVPELGRHSSFWKFDKFDFSHFPELKEAIRMRQEELGLKSALASLASSLVKLGYDHIAAKISGLS